MSVKDYISFFEKKDKAESCLLLASYYNKINDIDNEIKYHIMAVMKNNFFGSEELSKIIRKSDFDEQFIEHIFDNDLKCLMMSYYKQNNDYVGLFGCICRVIEQSSNIEENCNMLEEFSELFLEHDIKPKSKFMAKIREIKYGKYDNIIMTIYKLRFCQNFVVINGKRKIGPSYISVCIEAIGRYNNDNELIGKLLHIVNSKIEGLSVCQNSYTLTKLLERINHPEACILLAKINEGKNYYVFIHFVIKMNVLLPKFPNIMNGTFGNIYYALENDIKNEFKEKKSQLNDLFVKFPTNVIFEKTFGHSYYIYDILIILKQQAIETRSPNLPFVACSLYCFLNPDYEIINNVSEQENNSKILSYHRKLLYSIIYSYDEKTSHVKAREIIENNIDYVIYDDEYFKIIGKKLPNDSYLFKNRKAYICSGVVEINAKYNFVELKPYVAIADKTNQIEKINELVNDFKYSEAKKCLMEIYDESDGLIVGLGKMLDLFINE